MEAVSQKVVELPFGAPLLCSGISLTGLRRMALERFERLENALVSDDE